MLKVNLISEFGLILVVAKMIVKEGFLSVLSAELLERKFRDLGSEGT